MKIYTSTFDNIKNLNNVFIVSITPYTDNDTYKQFSYILPSKEFFEEYNGNDKVFCEKYLEFLTKFNVASINIFVQQLKIMSDSNDIVLCQNSDETNFRQVLSNYLIKFGYECEELDTISYCKSIELF